MPTSMLTRLAQPGHTDLYLHTDRGHRDVGHIDFHGDTGLRGLAGHVDTHGDSGPHR